MPFPFTREAWRTLAVVAVLFAVATGLRLHGSSTGYWHSAGSPDIRVRDVPGGVLLGTPRFVRGDEWYVWTPALLSQARQPQPFPVSNPSLGPGKTPLLMSLPARHYTMAFRPQLWGYFFLPLEYAFAWHWNAKVCGLFAGLFTLFWVLTGGRLGWAVCGALAVQFSGYVQWWFSTPAMLPEMLACWSLGVVAALTLFQPGPWRRHALAAVGLVWCAANFVLCCYPGFAVPLAYLAVCVVGGWVWQHGVFSWRGAAWVAGALALTALLLVPWAVECLPVMRLDAQTVYPGQRRVDGGGLTLAGYLSGLFSPALTERDFPHALGNASEASNFYPLWLLPLGLGAWAFARRKGAAGPWLRERGLMVGLTVYLAAMTLFCFVPLPPWFCNATGLSRCLEIRTLLGIGLAGTILLVLGMASRPAGGGGFASFCSHGAPPPCPAGTRPARGHGGGAPWLQPDLAAAAVAWTAGVLAFLAWDRAGGDAFLTPWRLAACGAAAVFGGCSYLWGPRWVLPPVWAGACVLKFALVNPLCVGLPELLDSPAMQRLRADVRADPAAGWAVYHSVQGVELIKSTGARVINGARAIPDFSIIDRLDPAHLHTDVYNRYGHLYFGEGEYRADVPVSLVKMVHCVVNIHPRRLRELFPDVRYIVSARAMPGLSDEGFLLIDSVPDNHLWVYRLAAAPRP